MKTLACMRTHFIDASVISEYIKLHKATCANIDTVLFIDNHTGFIKPQNDYPIQTINFNGFDIKCFLFNQQIFEKFNLPFYTDNFDNSDIGMVMWYCSDYPLYIIKKYLPEYDYYWSIESDVFCNGDSYIPFFEKYKNDSCDLIIKDYRTLENTTEKWFWKERSEWIYANTEKYASFFPVVRLSAKAADFLYVKRLEHSEAFESIKDDIRNRWIFCELFVPTELTANKFQCKNLNEENLRYQPNWNLNKQRIFEHPDFKLYHPVK